MEKARVYELAKDLNTTSKRLMEKLAEINIVVKNHMSLLEDNEVTALYNHIGVIKHDEKKSEQPEEKKAAPQKHTAVHQSRTEGIKDGKKDTKSAPRIIRTTEIIIDTKNEPGESKPQEKSDTPKGDVRGDVRGNVRNGQRTNNFVKTADPNSGLRSGYTRGSGIENNKIQNHNKYEENKTHEKDSLNKVVKSETTLKAPAAEPRNEVNLTGGIEPNNTQNNANKELKTETKITKNKAENDNNVTKIDGIKDDTGEDIKTVVNDNTSITNNSTEIKKESGHEDKRPEHSNRGRDNQGDRPYGDRPQGNRPYGDRPQGNRPYGDRPQGDRPNGNRPQGDRPQGDRPYGNRSQGDRPYGNRPQGDRPYGDRPQGDRPYGNRPQGDRPYGDRPQGDRPYGNRPQGDRPYGNRPQGDRPQGDRPYGDRPQGDRPYGNRPQGDRPYGNRPQGDRPYGNRPQGDRPYGNRPQGDRPQGGGYGNRPQGGGYGNRPLEIPKVELTLAQKEEMNSQKSEVRREFQNKDSDKDQKRDLKKDVPKGQAAAKNQRFKPQKVMLGEKKGLNEALSEDYILDEFYSDDGVKKTKKVKTKKEEETPKHIPHKAVLTQITIGESISVKELAEAMKKTSTEVIKKLMGLGIMATLNQEVDFDTAAIIADEFNIKAEKAVVVNDEDILFDDEEDDEKDLVPRPPVVVVMGHVDHGKTSLLDAIREEHVTESEAGGITQHIGAYMVKINDRNITFLDTPGHEAFTAMRARGAQVTDIAILVVAADDGVMPQTIEAINHAKAANVSIIVAINKIDKPGANPERVKQELTEHGIVAEEWGGDAIMVPVSAKKRENIDTLLEMVLLAADVLELKANPKKQAKGTVIEAKLDKTRGPVATLLVQRGTLSIGDSIVTGTTVGRIRAMVDDKLQPIKKAGPSTPVEILGLPEVPEAGEIFYAITDEKVAKHLAEKRRLKLREQTLKASAKVSLEDLFSQIKEGKVKDLNIIVKADVQGSVEAVKQSLEKLSNEEVRVKILHGGVGAITEADVTLASVSNAIIIGFNVRPASNVSAAAEDAGVDIRLYSVIYNAIEDVQAAMKGMLEPTFKEVVQGHAEIRQLFKVSGVGTIAGSYVTDGKVTRTSDVRILRDNIVIHEGKLASLKRFKDDAKEVAAGYECGLSIEKFNDLKEGDIVESFIMEEVAR